MAELKENCIEWITGQDVIYVTFSQTKYINKVKRLSDKYSEMITILHENEDGSIYARLPLKTLKLNVLSNSLSLEEKERRAERMREIAKKR